MSGTLYVEDVDVSFNFKTIHLFKCKITKATNTTGFSVSAREKGIPTKLFNCLKPIVDTMLHSYWKGLTLAKDDYNWIHLKGDESWECLNHLEREVGSYVAKQIQDGIKTDDVLLEGSLCQKK
jgi:hypothetical protein